MKTWYDVKVYAIENKETQSTRNNVCCLLSYVLKALFNNVSTLKKNLSCMALHAISVFDKV